MYSCPRGVEGDVFHPRPLIYCFITYLSSFASPSRAVLQCRRTVSRKGLAVRDIPTKALIPCSDSLRKSQTPSVSIAATPIIPPRTESTEEPEQRGGGDLLKPRCSHTAGKLRSMSCASQAHTRSRSRNKSMGRTGQPASLRGVHRPIQNRSVDQAASRLSRCVHRSPTRR